MKKLVFRGIYFIIFFLVFFVLINGIYMAIIARTDNDFKKRTESLHFEDPNFDLLVLGASTTLDGVDTELLTSQGIKAYNFAIGGSSIRTNVVQINEYLKNCSSKPRFVTLGINSGMVDTFDDEEIHPIVDVTIKDHKYTLDDVPMLKFKWLGFEFLKKLVSKNHRDAELSYGQLKFKKTVADNSQYVDQYLDLHRFETSLWVGEMIKLCSQLDIELIIIEMPGYKMSQNLTATGPHIISHSNGYQAELYNFNSREFCELFDDETDWIGNSHLNMYGAEKFTNELLNVLREKYATFP